MFIVLYIYIYIYIYIHIYSSLSNIIVHKLILNDERKHIFIKY